MSRLAMLNISLGEDIDMLRSINRFAAGPLASARETIGEARQRFVDWRDLTGVVSG